MRLLDHDAEWQALMRDELAVLEQVGGNCGFQFELRIAVIRTGHHQFHDVEFFRVVLGLSLVEAHPAFDREQVGHQAAGQHDDQSRVGELDARLAPGPAEPPDVGRNEVEQQDPADEMAAGKNRNPEPVAANRRPPHEKALEVLHLDDLNPQFHLCQGPGKYQNHCCREADDRQLHGADRFEYPGEQ